MSEIGFELLMALLVFLSSIVTNNNYDIVTIIIIFKN